MLGISFFSCVPLCVFDGKLHVSCTIREAQTISKALVLRYINFKRNFLRGKLKCLISCIHKENTYLTVKFSSKMLLQGIIY